MSTIESILEYSGYTLIVQVYSLFLFIVGVYIIFISSIVVQKYLFFKFSSFVQLKPSRIHRNFTI